MNKGIPIERAEAAVRAHRAAIDAEASDLPDVEISLRDGETGMKHGRLFVGVFSDSSIAPLVPSLATAAFATDWSLLINKVEVVSLVEVKSGLVVGLRNVSDSETFMRARLQRAAQAVGAALESVEGVDTPVFAPTQEELVTRMEGIIHDRLLAVANRIVPGGVEQGNALEIEGVMYNLLTPQTMSRELYESLQGLCEKLDLEAAQGHDCVDGFDVLQKAVDRLMDAAPWTFDPDEGVVPVSADRSRQIHRQAV